MLLSPLSELSTVLHADVRQRQLDCVLQILNTAGEILSFGWPAIIEIIGAVNDHHGEPLIRTAFQCLQLVITDFLTVMPWRCLPLCISTAAKFGSQTQELNISLTAIGLMVSKRENTIFKSTIYLSVFAVEHLGLLQSKSGQVDVNTIGRCGYIARLSRHRKNAAI